jgi:hypothetical protein
MTETTRPDPETTPQINIDEPVKVHVVAALPKPKRCRRGVSLRTFTLTAADPVQQVLPINLNRCAAYLQCTNAVAVAFTLHTSLADAQAANGGVTVPAANTSPYPLHTTDAIWATAADVDPSVTISVQAIIEED